MKKIEIEYRRLKYNILIQRLKEHAKNKNTRQTTNNWIKVWKRLDYDKRIDENESEALSKTLEVFQATVEKKDGEDYEPDSLRVIFSM